MIQTYLPSLVGGVMIGASAILFLVMTGRIAGISGIVGRLAQGASTAINGAFVVGLMLGPILFLALFGAWPKVTMTASLPLAVVAGLLVGFGSRMGSGCTSGHGVLGLARLSPRSFVAVVTFLLTGIVTVTIMRGSL
ncbi:YeeE/YedE family protein [Agrobacterium vitis]|nr:MULTISPECIES: YeeE/YedE thiosulfate transporter family protein [Rhizobium/Agrobacterium group]MCF1449467.1 YeeE/YedE family protein [Allorhizobium ampelinum]MCF1492248.1 YeeE/YedE family protein [Allorhizobium ampelinum]MVA45492.1 YeeE/YedE family protein [Agrobacterium vitis]